MRFMKSFRPPAGLRHLWMPGLIALWSILAPAVIPGAQSADVEGTWDMTVEMQQGTAHPSITLEQDGEKLSGSYQGQMGSSRLTGTIRRNDISFTVTLKFQEAAYTVVYSGVVEGTGMKGTVRFGSAGTGTWSAKKRKAVQ